MIVLPLSWSRYNDYVHCPAAYEARYINRMTEEVWMRSDARVVGHVSEALFQKILREKWTIETCLENIGLLLDEASKEHRAGSFDRAAVIARIQNNLFESHQKYIDFMTPLIQKRTIYTETNLGDDTVEGRVDVFLSQRKSNIIIDGKSTKHGKKYEDRAQLDFYAYCHWKHYGYNAYRLYYFYYSTGENTEFRVEERRFDSIERNIQALLVETDWEPVEEKITPTCNFCVKRKKCVTACKVTKPPKFALPPAFDTTLLVGFDEPIKEPASA